MPHTVPASDPPRPLPSTEYKLIRWHVHAALITVVISAVFGILVATKFNFPEFLGGHAWETWGRLRYNHTQGIFFGWLGNAFIAFFYYATPRLTHRPVTSQRLGSVLFWLWNFGVVLPGWALVMMGFSQPLEWAEFPLIVDAMVIAAFIIMLVQFVRPFLRVPSGELYVSGWYIIGGLIFTTLAYPIGNLVPQLVPGAMGAAFSGLWIHDAVGLFVTPLVLAMTYYVIPVTTHRPIYSHFLSMLGFWGLFFIYPLNGTHHYVYSAIPMSAQRGAILASAYLGVIVIIVVTNLLLSLRGASSDVGGNIALRFVWFGTIAYLVVSLQGSMQASMPVNRFIHFSDWVIGHSHLAMIGFASFSAAGGLVHVWSKVPGVRFHARAFNWSFWLLAVGLGLMVLDLTAAGLVEGQLWVSNVPWIDSVRAAYPYWLTRTISGVPILAGFVLFWVGLVTGPRNAEQRSVAASTSDAQPLTRDPDHAPSILNYGFVIAFGAGFCFFLLSFVALGVLPAMRLQAEIVRTAPLEMRPLTAAEQHGREIYGREGCAYCHTEQVRSVVADTQRFGAPTEAWETRYDYPQLWGTRRIGPDLSREHELRSNDWQLAHLYNPRSTVPDSIMPGYPWMFRGNAATPGTDALDLLAYIRSLGRDRDLAGPATTSHENDAMGMNASSDGATQAESPTRVKDVVMGLDASAPVFMHSDEQNEALLHDGQSVYAHNCSGCHGTNADGLGLAAAALLPKPVNLHREHFSDEHLATVLWDGVAGSSMPAWRQWDKRDLRAVAAYVHSLESPLLTPTLSASAELTASQTYEAHCVSCHGASGEGNGPAAGALKPTPVNFHVRQPSSERAREVLNNGVPGTAMPAWKGQLTPAQIELLIPYVQTMYGVQKGTTTP